MLYIISALSKNVRGNETTKYNILLYLEQILVVPIATVERQRVRLEAIFIYLFFFFKYSSWFLIALKLITQLECPPARKNLKTFL